MTAISTQAGTWVAAALPRTTRQREQRHVLLLKLRHFLGLDDHLRASVDRVNRVDRSACEPCRSQHAQIRLARIHHVIGDRSHGADCGHRGLLASLLDAVVMGRARDAPDEAARRHRNRVVRLEVFPARHPPGAGHHDAQPVGLVLMRCAWPKFEISFRYRSARYDISVESPLGVCRVVIRAKLDGEMLTVSQKRSFHWLMTARSTMSRAVALARKAATRKARCRLAGGLSHGRGSQGAARRGQADQQDRGWLCREGCRSTAAKVAHHIGRGY